MTPQAARRRLGAAARASKAAAARFDRGEITLAQFYAVLEAEEDLRILALSPPTKEQPPE